jgi:3-oxoacyl-[acyl-carrier-protein] synthase II
MGLRRMSAMSDRRVVVTGIGVVTPLGNDLKTFWGNAVAGKSGIRRIESLNTDAFGCKIGGEVVDFDPKPYFTSPKDSRRTDRYTQLAMGAAKMAHADSGIDVEATDRTRFGVMIGSGIGGLGTLETQHTTILTKGPERISPFTIPMMIANIASGMVAMEFGLEGPNMSIVTACATANHNIGEAWRMIKFGDADAFIAGCAEA